MQSPRMSGGLADLDLRQVMRTPLRNTEALGAALREFLTVGWCNPERLPRRAEVAALFAARFSFTRMIDGVSMVYRSVLNADQPHHSALLHQPAPEVDMIEMHANPYSAAYGGDS